MVREVFDMSCLLMLAVEVSQNVCARWQDCSPVGEGCSGGTYLIKYITWDSLTDVALSPLPPTQEQTNFLLDSTLLYI